MKNTFIVFCLIVCLLSGVLACGTSKKSTKEENMKEELPSAEFISRDRPLTGGNRLSTSPKVYVYKTKADYSHQVPVIMNEERTRIVSYPAPIDLKSGNGLRLPTPLNQGYLLDNKGINPHVAFLSYTYEAYSKLPEAPSIDVLLENIVEKYPLLEIYACGRWADYKDIVTELNEKIAKGLNE